MKRYGWIICIIAVALASCKGNQKMTHYEDLYSNQPATIYIAPVNDRTERNPVRTFDDSVYNASLNTAAKQLYLTASAPLVRKGYYVLGPLASAQIAASEQLTLKQLRNDPIADYHSDLGIDAILFITITNWETKANRWVATIEYTLRATQTGTEVMHTVVKASKSVNLDFKGMPVIVKDDAAFIQKYHCDTETAMRSRLVEITNQYVLNDFPSGARWRGDKIERYIPTHPEYFTLNIAPDGSIAVVQGEDIEWK